MARIVQGMAHKWQVSDSPIGSGDAGEVYTVARLDEPQATAMMKTPARIATAGTIQRQAGQIDQEARALALLDGLPDGKAHPPRLLDQAPGFTKGTGNYFIISETAPGKDLAALLTQTRQTDKPFPRRVIVTVLDALFDMFSRAHKAGILWNDVKLDHIYWHNPTGQVSVIDWGNAIFLESDNQRALPRWQDYQQMVDTLGIFLQQSAPDLYTDLGWDEFQGKTLDSPRVSVLARRIAYQQQVIGLQVMEHQSLIRVVLSADPSLEGLRRIADYKYVLEKIGAPWQSDDVLRYCQNLVESALAEGDHQTSVSGTALVWDNFGNSLGLSWHLMREYCRQADILTHPAFADLAKHTLRSAWGNALWAASTIAKHSGDPAWFAALTPIMRQKALETATPSPYQVGQTLLTWALGRQDSLLAEKIDRILHQWRTKGEQDEESPFEYELLDILRERADLPSQLRSQIKSSFALGEGAMRDLIKAWAAASFDDLPKVLRRVLSWDPNRWGILHVAQQVQDFSGWLDTLYSGPESQEDGRTFLEDLLKNRPPVERLLGSPPWFAKLTHILSQILQGAPISAYQSETRQYCPWLLPYPDIFAASHAAPVMDPAATSALLSQFAKHLKHWQDVDENLKQIRNTAPQVFRDCKRIADGFNTVFSLNANLDALKTLANSELPPELSDARRVLNALISWREHLADQDLSGAIHSLDAVKTERWTLAAQAGRVSAEWQHTILTALDAIATFTPLPDLAGKPSSAQSEKLIANAHACQEVQRLWAQIYTSGIFTQLLETLQTAIDGARSSFLEWRSTCESTQNQAERLLYHHHIDKVRTISNRLMRMAQHIRQAKLSLATLGEGDPLTLTMKLRNAEKILDHLVALEAELLPNPADRCFGDYQQAFKEIAEAADKQTRQALISALPGHHPFYAWLVKSTFA